MSGLLHVVGEIVERHVLEAQASRDVPLLDVAGVFGITCHGLLAQFRAGALHAPRCCFFRGVFHDVVVRAVCEARLHAYAELASAKRHAIMDFGCARYAFDGVVGINLAVVGSLALLVARLRLVGALHVEVGVDVEFLLAKLAVVVGIELMRGLCFVVHQYFRAQHVARRSVLEHLAVQAARGLEGQLAVVSVAHAERAFAFEVEVEAGGSIHALIVEADALREVLLPSVVTENRLHRLGGRFRFPLREISLCEEFQSFMAIAHIELSRLFGVESLIEIGDGIYSEAVAGTFHGANANHRADARVVARSGVLDHLYALDVLRAQAFQFLRVAHFAPVDVEERRAFAEYLDVVVARLVEAGHSRKQILCVSRLREHGVLDRRDDSARFEARDGAACRYHGFAQQRVGAFEQQARAVEQRVGGQR